MGGRLGAASGLSWWSSHGGEGEGRVVDIGRRITPERS